MACDQECKVKLKKVTWTSNWRYQRWAGPVTQNDPDLTAAEVGTAVNGDIARRQMPSPLQPACARGCKCRTITETYAKNEDGTPKVETQWLPVDVSYSRNTPTSFAAGTYTIEYEANVQVGIGTGVCDEDPPTKVSSAAFFGEDAVLLAGAAAAVTDDAIAVIADKLGVRRGG